MKTVLLLAMFTLLGTTTAQPAAARSTPTTAQRATCPPGQVPASIQAVESIEDGLAVVMTLRGPGVNRQEGLLTLDARRLGVRVGGTYCVSPSPDDMNEGDEAQALREAQRELSQAR